MPDALPELAEINRSPPSAADQQACFASMRTEMAAAGIYIVEPKNCGPRARMARTAVHIPVICPS